jgi:hypothetical protein
MTPCPCRQRQKIPLWGIFVLLAGGLIWLTCSGTAAAKPGADCVQAFDSGSINWSTGQITATGSAAPEKQADGSLTPLPGSARAQATARLIQLLKQIRITPELTVGQYAATHDKILAGIEKTAQDAETVRQIYTSALDVDIRVETSIYGGFLQLVLPDHIRQIPKITDQNAKPGKTGTPPATVSRINKIPHTGLIIDARQLSLTPILYPVIVSEEGKEIYSSLFISREFAVQYGVCTYICDMDAAVAFRRIGSNPLVFKALRKEGSTSGNIVISLADAKIIEKVTERHRFFKECRVIIVTGP